MSDRLRASFDRMKRSGARTVSLDAGSPVRFAPLREEGGLPLLATPELPGVSLTGWAEANRGLVEEQLLRSGAILFRGFGISSREEFEAFCAALAPELMGYGERSTPRREVGGKVYTSTEYPADQHIPMHNELSYTHAWPGKIWFYCHAPAAQGGETPIADSRQVYRALDPAVRERFASRQVLYVRNFGEGLGLTWREAFQTDDWSAVEEYCRNAGIEFEWRPGERLRTRAVRPAVLRHPSTGEDVWFNQAHLHHVSALPEATRRALLEVVSPDDLPFNTYYGDGGEIEAEALDQVRRAYAETSVRFPWQRGDVLMLDNVAVAHGRASYTGERKILVAMA
jgi:alpha-ketoglutarate-dependent taurine dioxygenase